jgi:autotransporter-associated beta strand protein
MSGAKKRNTTSTNTGRRARQALLAIAAGTSVAALSSHAFASTFSWTRGGTNNNWTTAANWASPDGGTPPPNAADADVIFSGTPAVSGSVTQNGAFTIHGITVTADFNPGANFNVSGSGTSASSLTLGAGGIHSDNLTWQLKFTTGTAGAGIAITDPQIWYNLAPAGGAGGTLSVDRTLSGPATATVTKQGNGLLILSRDNTNFLGGFSINEGTIRLQNSSHAFGPGTLTMNTDNLVGITASTDLPQILDGPIVFGGNGTASFGGSFPFTWNGAVNFLNDKVVTNGLNIPITANGVISGGRYIKQGSGTLTLNAANTNAGFTIRGGVVPVGDDTRLGVAGGTLGLGGVDNGAGTITTGTLLLTADLNTTRPIALDNLGGAIDTQGNNGTFGNVVGDGTTTIGALNKYGTGNLTTGGIQAGTLNVAAGTVTVATNGGNSGASRVGTVLLADSGSGPTTALDLNDNDLIVTNGTVAGIQATINNARHSGAWDQAGITSSAARSNTNHSTTLGVLSGAEYTSVGGGTFDGFAVAPSDVVVKYTYYGDTDFNGKVNFDDYVRTDNGFNNHLTGWLNGDFDGNGQVNFDDYVLIDLAFNTQSGTLGRALSFLDGSDRSSKGMGDPALQKLQDHLHEFGNGFAGAFLSAVPEPGSAVMGGGFVMMLMSRRRRRCSRVN